MKKITGNYLQIKRNDVSFYLEFDSQNDKNALGIGSLVVFLVEKVRTIFVFSFVLKCFSFFFEE